MGREKRRVEELDQDLFLPNCHFKIELYRKGEQNEEYSELLGIPAINLNWQNPGYQKTSLISIHLHFNTTSDKPKVYQ